MNDSDVFLKAARRQKIEGVSPSSSRPVITVPHKQDQEKGNARVHTHMQTPTHVSTQPHPEATRSTPTNARTDTRVHACSHDNLKKVLLNKKHLTSFTFRFKAEELDTLDQVIEAVNHQSDRKISKNDLVRLGVSWLLQDYNQNQEKSMLAKVIQAL